MHRRLNRIASNLIEPAIAIEPGASEQDDPIVAAVRASRRQLLEQYGSIEGYLGYVSEVHAQRVEREREEAKRRKVSELGKSA